jgi:hypothetical protein
MANPQTTTLGNFKIVLLVAICRAAEANVEAGNDVLSGTLILFMSLTGLFIGISVASLPLQLRAGPSRERDLYELQELAMHPGF